MIRAGKHVLCEKPLADTLENAKAMAQAEEDHPEIITSTGFTYRRNASVAQIRKLVETGHLGTIHHINARYWCDYGADPSTPMAWRYSGPMGSGALGDVGSHLIDTAETICGPLVSVAGGTFLTAIKERPVARGHVTRGTTLDNASAEMASVTNDDVASFTATFSNGAVGTFSASRIAWGMPNAMMIDVHGSRGRAYWDLARTGEIMVDDASAPAGLSGPRQVLVNPTFPYLACLILRTASGCDIVAVKFPGACPGFPDFKTSLTEFFLEFGKVKALHLLQYAVHGFLDFRFVDFANVLRLYKVPFLGYGIGGFRCLFPYPVVPVQFPGKGNPVCQYVQVGLLFLALRTAVPDDDVLVVRQPHALHEVVTKFRPVRIRKGGAFLYRGADLET